MDLDRLDDHALILRSRASAGPERAAALQTLYRRYYDRVGSWALRLCNQPEEAAELAQEVFVRVHARIDTFRLDSAFSTWIYRVTRNLAIDRGLARKRKPTEALDDAPEPRDPAPHHDETLARREVVDRFMQAVARDLDPTEARVLYLHYVDGVQLADVTTALQLENLSGAKAFVVSARRKLARHFGRWLDHYRDDTARSPA
jgi:RNA polymerase sigma-70 factor (ECF subfamily)